MDNSGGTGAGWSYHEVYGVVLASNRPIALLGERAPTTPDLVLRWHDTALDLSGRSWFRHWKRADGSTVFRAAHTATGGYIIDFPGTAVFELDATGGEITVWCPDTTPAPTAASILIDQVVPRVLAQRHDLVFHGSAVVVDGGAVVCMGPSGRGKSTLAAHLGARGHPVLSDDCVRFERRGEDGNQLVVHPAYPGVRLWGDSLDAVAPGALQADSAPTDPTKHRFADTAVIGFAAEPAPVRQVLFLAPATDEALDGLSLEPLAGAAVIGELVACQFLLDDTNRAEVQASFEAAALLGRTTPCARLHLPRDLAGLDDHAAELLDLLAAGHA